MSKWVRQIHRWLAGIFTLTVIATVIFLSQPEIAAWLVYVPLFPLILMLLTGLYMFVLPYAVKWRARRARQG